MYAPVRACIRGHILTHEHITFPWGVYTFTGGDCPLRLQGQPRKCKAEQSLPVRLGPFIHMQWSHSDATPSRTQSPTWTLSQYGLTVTLYNSTLLKLQRLSDQLAWSERLRGVTNYQEMLRGLSPKSSNGDNRNNFQSYNTNTMYIQTKIISTDGDQLVQQRESSHSYASLEPKTTLPKKYRSFLVEISRRTAHMAFAV